MGIAIFNALWHGEAMATTIDVYPASVEVPSTREVLALGSMKLWAYLSSLGVDVRPQVQAELLARGSHHAQELVLDAPFAWPENHYMWFTVGTVNGGTDAYCQSLDDKWGVDASTHGLPFSRAHIDDPTVFKTARRGGRWWYFRRSAGQSALVHVLYGCLASALAELTNRVVYSDDSAWDAERFPARSVELDRWFMRPEDALSDQFRVWAQRIQDGVMEEALGEEGEHQDAAS
ncbi:hypothetical protein MF271_21995 (plasmid) [Deinococcus sp. KNUC1210]|uniref:hypothetical protein n=1 Tax=Deinococcus sp. KNUC1210 TaxID=2917691 RepID=UPI001EF0D900|nr:hypothetical protein [Deinococcus sp. KNUC1210]ULH18152.1 hypothetical protein MF271_21995 [Deinococcus sp. KNUC1210]